MMSAQECVSYDRVDAGSFERSQAWGSMGMITQNDLIQYAVLVCVVLFVFWSFADWWLSREHK